VKHVVPQADLAAGEVNGGKAQPQGLLGEGNIFNLSASVMEKGVLPYPVALRVL